jgi:hypothetical protein
MLYAAQGQLGGQAAGLVLLYGGIDFLCITIIYKLDTHILRADQNFPFRKPCHGMAKSAKVIFIRTGT